MTDQPVIKKFMVVNRKAPHGTIYALEVLEMVLISAMFDQDVHVVFLDDGVQQLRKGQSPAALEMKDFSKTYRALDGYGIEKVYVERESLTERGLGEDDLVIPVELIDRAEMARLMDGMDVVLSA
ncbi:sulfurtransferase complex subunit TusC [Magnetospirillum fulvum]|uniref:tRNA 2-thiouridine synthesizing protein C n=1 Tax=Magnetospirillum fulvum TaxID=1082 RepID=A0A1H6HWY1_MAGFU|nr:sulfurtransferase complex subunit TusC [Magnetospirillum fulvum]SEH40584.1 tRNA 2-thiouridine synthesizing protein C [Magnetospirillum fulvum]